MATTSAPSLYYAGSNSAAPPVLVGRTRDRSVVGTLVEFTAMTLVHLEDTTDAAAALMETEGWLAGLVARPADRRSEYHFPDRAALDLIEGRWNQRKPERSAVKVG